MKVVLASDHAGFELKNHLKQFLDQQGYEVTDVGPGEYDGRDDYPDYIIRAAKKVAEIEDAKGIVAGYSGQGEAIAANKVEGIRAAVYYSSNPEIIEKSRTHNDANVLSLGAGFLENGEVEDAVEKWLETDFPDTEKHSRRINKIESFEELC